MHSCLKGMVTSYLFFLIKRYTEMGVGGNSKQPFIYPVENLDTFFCLILITFAYWPL